MVSSIINPLGVPDQPLCAMIYKINNISLWHLQSGSCNARYERTTFCTQAHLATLFGGLLDTRSFLYTNLLNCHSNPTEGLFISFPLYRWKGGVTKTKSLEQSLLTGSNRESKIQKQYFPKTKLTVIANNKYILSPYGCFQWVCPL